MKNGLKHKNDEEELLRDWEKYCRSRKIRQRKSFKNYTLKMKLKYDKKKMKTRRNYLWWCSMNIMSADYNFYRDFSQIFNYQKLILQFHSWVQSADQ